MLVGTAQERLCPPYRIPYAALTLARKPSTALRSMPDWLSSSRAFDSTSEAALPVGIWKVEFTNGVVEECDIFKFDGNGHVFVAEPQRRKPGTMVAKEGSFVLTFTDDRVERWTPVGKRFIVEHWFPASRLPAATPVLGIAERAN